MPAYPDIAAGYREAAQEHRRCAARLRQRGEYAAAARQDGYAVENVEIAKRLESEE